MYLNLSTMRRKGRRENTYNMYIYRNYISICMICCNLLHQMCVNKGLSNHIFTRMPTKDVSIYFFFLIPTHFKSFFHDLAHTFKSFCFCSHRLAFSIHCYTYHEGFFDTLNF